MKLLIGYDGSVPADGALFDLIHAGLPDKAQAQVIVAVPIIFSQDNFALNSSQQPLWFASTYPDAVKNARDAEVQARIKGERAARFLKQRMPDWTVKAVTTFDSPAHGILAKADAWKPDLIVVGSRGWNPLGGLLLGGTAQKVLGHAHGNVRIGRPLHRKKTGPPKILIAVDGLKYADAALAEVERRNWPKGTRARLLAVMDIRLNLDEVMASLDKVSAKAPALGGAWPWMEKKLQRAADALAAKGIKASTAILDGDPRNAILAEAKEMAADCIVLGSRGLSGIQRFFLGSVSSGVAAHASCSVEIVHKIFREPRGKAKSARAS